MALQKKYYYSFKDLDSSTYTVEIWQDTASVINSEEVLAGAAPFNVEYINDGLFKPVRGSGCDITLMSMSDMKFLGLYTANMMEYQIRLYKGSDMIWCGYLDSELYSEPFSDTKNYPVRLTGSDGFALLERINYIQDNGDKYSGFSTQWDAIKNILNKLKLPYKNIYVGISTTSSQLTIGASETIFHKTYTINANWYNEDGEAETCRKVLDSILQPYGAYIIQANGNIYITDLNSIATAGNVTFKKYNSSFVYVANEVINMNLGDLATIGFAETNQDMNINAGYNKQIIKYSPYVNSEVMMFDASAKDEFSEVYTTLTSGSTNYLWTETQWNKSVSWNRHNLGQFCSYVGANDTISAYNNIDKKDSYLKMTAYATNDAIPANLSFTYKKQLPTIIPANAKIKITGKAFCRLSSDLENPDFEVDKFDNVFFLKLRFRLKVGDKQVVRDDSGVYSWIDANSTDYTKSLKFTLQDWATDSSGNVIAPTYNPINDKWLDIRLDKYNIGTNYVKEQDYLIPINSGFSGGEMTFEIYDWDISAYPSSGAAASHGRIKASVKDVRLKDLEISITDEFGNDYNTDDTEYIGYMNELYKNEAELITILQGTTVTNNVVEKACLLGYNTGYFFLTQWTRQGKTDCIENLLLRTIVSNYTNKRIEITAAVKPLSSVLGCVKYQAFLPNKNFLVTSARINYTDNTYTTTLEEVVIDSLEINKSF